MVDAGDPRLQAFLAKAGLEPKAVLTPLKVEPPAPRAGTRRARLASPEPESQRVQAQKCMSLAERLAGSLDTQEETPAEGVPGPIGAPLKGPGGGRA